jgi:glucose/arabinose dehydrogenase
MRHLAAGLLLLALPASGQDSPAISTQQAAFEPAEGWGVLLFASEAEGLENPIQMRFDARGRLWVLCTPSYPQAEPGVEPDDRVVILEDGNHDGRADRSTVFVRGLHTPTGLDVLADGSGCLVLHGRELLLLRDADGDGRADSRETLVRGFGVEAIHQGVHGLHLDPLGRLWLDQGAATSSRLETRQGTVALSGAGAWRFDPRHWHWQAFPAPAGVANPRGRAFDRSGTPWSADAEGGGIRRSGQAGEPAAPGAFHALLWLESSHVPAAWRGRLLAASPDTRRVEAFTPGAGLPPAGTFLSSSHDSFRPVDLQLGPEGAVYVCDEFDPLAGPDAASLRHPTRDRLRGRIWRLAAEDLPPAEPRDWVKESPALWLGLLDHPDTYPRTAARRLLLEARPEDVLPGLRTGLTQSISAEAAASALGIALRHGDRAAAEACLARLQAADDPRWSALREEGQAALRSLVSP